MLINKIFIVTDGASRGDKIGAIGYGIYNENWDVLEENAELIGRATNNVAEYKAVIKALECAMGHCRWEAVHYSDSQLVVKQINGDFRVTKPHLKPLLEEVFNKQRFFRSIEHHYLPRGNPKIVRIDALVDELMESEGFSRRRKQ